MFNNAKESDKTGQGNLRLPYFFNLVKVTGFNTHLSSKDSTLFKLELESKEDDPDFVGFDRLDKTKAKGKLAEVDLGIYTKATNFSAVADLMQQLALLASKAGVDYDKQLMPIFKKAFVVKDGNPVSLTTETQEYLTKVVRTIVKVLVKANYFWVFVKAEEYQKGKFGNYSFLQYNAGSKDDMNFLVWCKAEACITKVYEGEGKDEGLTIGVEGVNSLGVNKGEAFKKMRQVGNEYELKPFKDGDYEEDTKEDLDDDFEDDGNDVDDLPF